MYLDGYRNRWIQKNLATLNPRRVRLINMGRMTDEEVAQIGKALGDPNRLAIFSHISRHDELFCGEMHAKHAISSATLSHHLKVLHDLGLIACRKEGLNMFYRVVPEKFADYLKHLSQIGPKSKR